VENFDNTQNHYQNLFVETISKLPNVNAVSILGDAIAVVDDAKVWGGFFSARTGCEGFAKGGVFASYGNPPVTCDNIDNQLVGVEIDVLNSAKPGVVPNLSKVGLSIVGFGNPNTMAIEVRSHDTDKKVEGQPGGAFESAFYVADKSIQPEYGRMIVADFDHAKIGLDFRRPLFADGFISFRSEQVGTGIKINEGKSGEFYGGSRWGAASTEQWLTARAGKNGFRLVSNDNTRELMTAEDGAVRLYGQAFLNNKPLATGDIMPPDWPEMALRYWALWLGILLAATAFNVAITFLLLRRTGHPAAT
jgi:hypothetical protein